MLIRDEDENAEEAAGLGRVEVSVEEDEKADGGAAVFPKPVNINGGMVPTEGTFFSAVLELPPKLKAEDFEAAPAAGKGKGFFSAGAVLMLPNVPPVEGAGFGFTVSTDAAFFWSLSFSSAAFIASLKLEA